MHPGLQYLYDVFIATGNQLFIVLGPLLVIALIMHFTASGLQSLAFSVLGEKVFVYGFKLVGTPVHELGHALFSLLFGHKILAIKLFDPKGKEGAYGYVKTRYTRRNPFHETGLFFSGIGPVLICSIALYAITWLLLGTKVHQLMPVSITAESFLSLSAISALGTGIISAINGFGVLLMGFISGSWWKLLLYFYLLFSIGSSMTLSPQDISQAAKGFLFVTVVLLLVNLATYWTGDHLLVLFSRAVPYISYFLAIMTMALITQILFALILSLIAFIKTLLIR